MHQKIFFGAESIINKQKLATPLIPSPGFGSERGSIKNYFISKLPHLFQSILTQKLAAPQIPSP